MAIVDRVLKELYTDILERGQKRNTRTGPVLSIWNCNLEFVLDDEFPAVTSKKLGWNAVVGELLWFLSGSTSLKELKYYTFNDRESNKWTIWSDDIARWGSVDDAGNLYGKQWRNFNGETNKPGVDQIVNLIDAIKDNPNNRDHIVMAWNPHDIHKDSMALKPCHLGFQCYVTEDNKLNLHWVQRSVDSFLGLPYNIASYALLTHLLARWTGLGVGKLSCWLGDTHLYENHLPAIAEYINNPEFFDCNIQLPDSVMTLEETVNQNTAKEFEKSLINYVSMDKIDAPLSVGDVSGPD